MKLDHCPFCDAQAPDTVVINELGRFFRVYCNGCGAAGPIADLEPEAAKRWNASSKAAAFKQAAELVRSEITRVQDLCSFPPSKSSTVERLRRDVLGRVDGLVWLEKQMLEQAKNGDTEIDALSLWNSRPHLE